MSSTITGIVVSTKMQKTVVVRVEMKYRHPLYQKVIKKHRNFKAHNELEDIKEGDQVIIKQVKPISKEKSYLVVKKDTKLISLK